MVCWLVVSICWLTNDLPNFFCLGKTAQNHENNTTTDTSLSLPNTTGESDCGICSGEVRPDDQAVDCDGCNKWIHIICGKVTTRLYKKIKNAPTNNPVEWFCATKDKNKSSKNNPETQRSPNAAQAVTGNPDDCSKISELHTTQNILNDVMTQNKTLRETVENLQSELERTNLMLIHSKEENITINQELINQTQTIIVKLNQKLHSYYKKHLNQGTESQSGK